MFGLLLTNSLLHAQAYLFNQANFAVGSTPQSLAVGDFNGDGKPDLAVTNYTAGTVSILLGKADGTFLPHVDYQVGQSPSSVAVGDFNGDGNLDLAITLAGSNSVAILLGNGDGTFGTPSIVAVGGNGQGITTGDFNKDGNLDLAVSVSTGSTGAVSVLLGNGDGTFEPDNNFALPYTPGMVVAADLNNDGKPDLVVAMAAYPGAFAVLLANGDGTFQSYVNYSIGGSVSTVVLGDFNRDGNLDVVVPNSGSPGALIFLGKGDGTFQSPAQISTGGATVSTIVAGDFNGDGKLDIAFANAYGIPSVIEILVGNGDGTFQSPPVIAGMGAGVLATADFNSDGKLDLAFSGPSNSTSIGVLLGNGDATFSRSVTYSTSAPSSSVVSGIVTGDFIGNGKQDMAVVTEVGQYSPGTVSIFIGNEDGTFQAPVNYAVGTDPQYIIAGDFNGDGKLDLAVANYGNSAGQGSVSILLGNGDGTFQSHVDYAVGYVTGGMTAGDFNGDGKLDLAVASTNPYPTTSELAVAILLGNGDGTFQSPSKLSVANTYDAAYGVAAADFNHDGKIDLAVTTFDYVYILLGNGNGSFGSPVAYSANAGADAIAVADFNGDGNVDLAFTGENGDESVSVMLGKGDGTFKNPVVYLGGNGVSSIAIGDFNGDGKPDIAASCTFTESANVLLGKGDGTFSLPYGFAASGSYASAIGAADFNGDGVPDLVIGNGSSGTVSIFLSRPVIALWPPQLAFGPLATGSTSSEQMATVSNPGSAPLAFAGLAATGQFEQTNTCGAVLAIGANCTVSVAFAPSSTGGATGAINFTDDALGSPQLIALSGTGFNGAGDTPSPSSLAFPNQEVTTTSSPEEITITNNGAAVLNVTKVAANGDFAQSNNCTSLNPGDTCSISATFTPSVLGERTGTITVTDNAWDNPMTVNLSGKGVGPMVSLTPPSLTFGNQLVGTTSAAQNIAVNNNGHSPLTVKEIIATGDFSQTNTCNNSVAPGSSCSVSVTFTPPSMGALAGGLTVTSNASNSPNSALLTGTGVAAYIVVSSTSLYFGNQLVGIASASYPITVYNYGQVNLTFTSIATTGNFSQTNNCAGGVPPQGRCTVNVSFSPTAVGSASGTLNFVDNALNTSPVVTLTGTGTTSYSRPSISSITPTAAVAGGSDFTLTVNGYYFGPSSVLYWNGSPLSTTVVTGGQLTASIPASDIASTGAPLLTVINPAPGGSSAAVGFDVIPPSPPLAFGRSDVAVSTAPKAMVSADFNGDGQPDLAVVNTGGYNVSILLGNGDGTFQTAVGYGVGLSPNSIAVADFNHDGKLDLAVGNSGCPYPGGVCGSGSVTILLGNGDGTFQTPLVFSVGTSIIVNSLAAGNFNGDGNVDLAVGIRNSQGGAIAIYLGQGDGTFQAGAVYRIGPQGSQPPQAILVADFNGDGKADLAVADGSESNNVSILLGNGDGTFQGPVQYTAGTSPYALLAADFNGDGKLDLAVANADAGTNSVSILFGNGDGTFQAHVDYPTGVGPHSLALGDFNGDGKPDLIAADAVSSTLSVLFGNGDGTFQPSQDFLVGASPASILAGDFNSDGQLDLVVANFGSNTVSVLLRQVPDITAEGASLTFGNQPIGTTSVAQPLALKNTGSALLTISGITFTGTNAADFGQTNNCGNSLAVGASCTIGVTFTPSLAGSESATLVLTDNAAGSPFNVALNGTGTAAAVSFSSLGLGFGSQPLSTPSTALVETVTNTGTSNLTVSGVTIGGANTGDFSKSADTCTAAVVVPNATCTVSIKFTPTALGSRSASLTFIYNAANSPQSVTLAGTGTAPTATLSAPTLSFGNQPVNTPSTAMVETVTNNGTASLIISTVTIAGSYPGDFAKSADTCTGATVAPTSTCTVSVTFTPLITGNLVASLSFADNAPGTPQTVSLSGTGTAPAVSLSSYSLSFTAQLLGTTSSAQTLTVTNTGTGNLHISAVTFGGTNAQDFAKSADTCSGASVAPNATCTVSVVFTPLAMGSRNATLSFADDASNSPQSVSLWGTGIAPVVTLSASSLKFANQMPGTTSPALTAKVTNTGTANLTVSTVTITGTNASDFAKTSDTCAGTIVAPSNTCSVSLTFTPSALGRCTAALVFTDNASASPQTMTLTGTSLNPVPFISQPLIPASALPGGQGFTLTVNGVNFVSGAEVNWNGGPLATNYVSARKLTAMVPAANTVSPSTAEITVANPGTATVSNPVPFSVTPYGTDVTFANAPGSPILVGTWPTSIAVGDFNGDGRLDLAVGNSVGESVVVLLSNGDGTFAPASVVATGIYPDSIAVADLNGDGKPDLIISNDFSQSLIILLGNGDGTFTRAAQSPATGVQPEQVAVADFNGDGALDIAVTNPNANTLTILLGNGDGTFTPAAGTPATGNTPIAIAAGDFNGDGKLDLAVVNQYGNSLTILLGNGDGTFTPAASPATGSNPQAIAVGDFNGDGILDLAVASAYSNNVTILLGKGDGTFTAAASPAIGGVPVGVAVGDFNGDGKLDLAITNGAGSSVTILLGNGDGTFTASASSPVTGQYPTLIVVGDFNGDGRLDLATPDEGTNSVSVLLQLPPQWAVVSPGSLTFSNQNVGTTSATQSVTLSNKGAAALTIASIVTSGDFGVNDNCKGSVAANSLCTISVTFTPTATGLRTGTLTVTDNSGGVAGSTQQVNLSGTGAVEPVVSLSPSSLAFPPQVVGTRSNPQTVTLSNTGYALVTILSVSTGGDFAQTNNCGTTMSAGGNRAIAVTFKPLGPGTRTGTLTIFDSALGSPHTVALSGTGLVFTAGPHPPVVQRPPTSPEPGQPGAPGGTGSPIVVGPRQPIVHPLTPANAQPGATATSLAPAARLSSSSLVFSGQVVGTTGSAQTITLTNPGDTPVPISSITTSGDFTQTNTCGTTLEAGANCTISVTFKPGAAGAKSGTLSISEDPTGNLQTVTLSGTSVASEVGPHPTVTPTSPSANPPPAN
jgi:hypothetical protein